MLEMNKTMINKFCQVKWTVRSGAKTQLKAMLKYKFPILSFIPDSHRRIKPGFYVGLQCSALSQSEITTIQLIAILPLISKYTRNMGHGDTHVIHC